MCPTDDNGAVLHRGKGIGVSHYPVKVQRKRLTEILSRKSSRTRGNFSASENPAGEHSHTDDHEPYEEVDVQILPWIDDEHAGHFR